MMDHINNLIVEHLKRVFSSKGLNDHELQLIRGLRSFYHSELSILNNNFIPSNFKVILDCEIIIWRLSGLLKSQGQSEIGWNQFNPEFVDHKNELAKIKNNHFRRIEQFGLK